jgi:uroporphyrinogen III methyltransferase/synthase
MAGRVYLVGAGTGSLAYLTLRAKHLLSRAEVLIYDALVDIQLLCLVPPDCLKLDVGKRGGGSSTPQTEIDRLLVTYCQQGKQVIRLKGGDPFIFGRANSEIQALQRAGCNFEVVPGISSALAAPLLAGIPLTDRQLSRCFAVLSAHEPDSLNWQALAQIDTLAILMGGRNLVEIVEQLQANGRSPSEPIAIIRNAGRTDQKVWCGTLADIVGQTLGIALSPAVIIVGKVVNLRSVMQSPSLPLSGKTVLVTRAAEQSSQFARLLQLQGAAVIEMPALEIRPPSSWQGLDAAIAHLADFDWLILASANGVEYFFSRLTALAKDVRALAGVKIAVVGKKTAAVLKNYGLQPDFVPPNFVADSLVENFPETLPDKKILFPRVESGGREVLVQELAAQGAAVEEVAAYQSACPEAIFPAAWQALQEKATDVITFASSKTVHNFHYLVSQAIGDRSNLTINSLLENVCLASIGPQTSKTCRELLGRVDVEAKEYTLEGLTEALVHSYQ